MEQGIKINTDVFSEREKYLIAEVVEQTLKAIKQPPVRKEMSLNALHALYGISKGEIVRAVVGGRIGGKKLPSGQYRINVSSFVKYFL